MRRLLLAAVSWAVCAAALAMVGAAVFLPRVAGATPFTVLTGSMAPDLPPGTLVVVRPVESSAIGINDVITFQLRSGDSAVVTHRVVGVGLDGRGRPVYRTKGDANQAPDSSWVRPEQVRGELWYAVPWIGHVSASLDADQRELGARGVGGLLAAYALLLVGRAVVDRRRTSVRERVDA